MLSRRGLLATAALFPLPAYLTGRSAFAAGGTLRLGTLPFGTAAWEAAVIKARGLDAANGFTLDVVKLAGNDAARIAFQGGQIDTIVSDLLWAARINADGRVVRFSPYSSTEGAVMVPPGSTITSLADLSGKTLGIAGGALDKTWILLKAKARQSGNLDLETGAKLAFGAPPLLMQKLESGELDAALLYWNYCARLEAKDFRRVIGADDIMRGFGAKGAVALLGYLFEGTLIEKNGETVRAFLQASRAAKALLASDPASWEIVRPLMAAEDTGTFESLKRDFLSGIPSRPIAEERADGTQIFETLARLGGTQLVGTAKTLPPDFYLDAATKG